MLDVAIKGVDDPLGVTNTHPVWSEDRQNFIPAGELAVGENLRRADGTLVQISRITPRRGPPEVVYNLEIDGQHVYHVGSGGVLVHNSCPIIKPEWGKDRIVKELHDNGYVLDRSSTSGGGMIYIHQDTRERVRIMPRPDRRRFRNESPAKFEGDFYYRYQENPNLPEGPHIPIARP